MSLSDLAAIGSLISGIAVLVSLVYLSLQIRQNTRHTRALIQQGRAARITDLQFRSAEPHMAHAVLSADGIEPSIDAVAHYQFERYCTACFVSLEDSFHQSRIGLLDDELYRSFYEGVVGVMSNQAVQKQWLARRAARGDSAFALVVDDIIAKSGASPPDQTDRNMPSAIDPGRTR